VCRGGSKADADVEELILAENGAWGVDFAGIPAVASDGP